MAIVADPGVPLLDDADDVSVKVTSINPIELEDKVLSALYDIACTNRDALEQLKLLNLRFEEAFNTQIDERDV